MKHSCFYCRRYLTSNYEFTFLCPYYSKETERIELPVKSNPEKEIDDCSNFLSCFREVKRFDFENKLWVECDFMELKAGDYFTLKDAEDGVGFEDGKTNYAALSDATKYSNLPYDHNYVISLKKVDEIIDEWHNNEDPRPLHEYLGMSFEAYAEFMKIKK